MSRCRFAIALTFASVLAAPPAVRGQNPSRALADRLSWFNYAMDYAGGVAEARVTRRLFDWDERCAQRSGWQPADT